MIHKVICVFISLLSVVLALTDPYNVVAISEADLHSAIANTRSPFTTVHPTGLLCVSTNEQGAYVIVQSLQAAGPGAPTSFAALAAVPLAAHRVLPAHGDYEHEHVSTPSGYTVTDLAGLQSARWCAVQGTSLHVSDGTLYRVYDLLGETLPHQPPALDVDVINGEGDVIVGNYLIIRGQEHLYYLDLVRRSVFLKVPYTIGEEETLHVAGVKDLSLVLVWEKPEGVFVNVLGQTSPVSSVGATKLPVCELRGTFDTFYDQFADKLVIAGLICHNDGVLEDQPLLRFTLDSTTVNDAEEVSLGGPLPQGMVGNTERTVKVLNVNDVTTILFSLPSSSPSSPPTMTLRVLTPGQPPRPVPGPTDRPSVLRGHTYQVHHLGVAAPKGLHWSDEAPVYALSPTGELAVIRYVREGGACVILPRPGGLKALYDHRIDDVLFVHHWGMFISIITRTDYFNFLTTANNYVRTLHAVTGHSSVVFYARPVAHAGRHLWIRSQDVAYRLEAISGRIDVAFNTTQALGGSVEVVAGNSTHVIARRAPVGDLTMMYFIRNDQIDSSTGCVDWAAVHSCAVRVAGQSLVLIQDEGLRWPDPQAPDSPAPPAGTRPAQLLGVASESAAVASVYGGDLRTTIVDADEVNGLMPLVLAEGDVVLADAAGDNGVAVLVKRAGGGLFVTAVRLQPIPAQPADTRWIGWLVVSLVVVLIAALLAWGIHTLTRSGLDDVDLLKHLG